jgi:DNA-directed RNA polymerase subunit RPC12/RpoP
VARPDPGAYVIAVFIVLVFSTSIFFTFSKNGALKKRLLDGMMLVAGCVFGYDILKSPHGNEPGALLFLILMAFFIGLGRLMTQFCDACGKPLKSNLLWPKMRFCPYCGKKIIDKPKPRRLPDKILRFFD